MFKIRFLWPLTVLALVLGVGYFLTGCTSGVTAGDLPKLLTKPDDLSTYMGSYVYKTDIDEVKITTDAREVYGRYGLLNAAAVIYDSSESAECQRCTVKSWAVIFTGEERAKEAFRSTAYTERFCAKDAGTNIIEIELLTIDEVNDLGSEGKLFTCITPQAVTTEYRWQSRNAILNLTVIMPGRQMDTWFLIKEAKSLALKMQSRVR